MGKKIQSVEPNVADLANGWMKSYNVNADFRCSEAGYQRFCKVC